MRELMKWEHSIPVGWEIVPLKSIAHYSVSNVDKLTKEDEIPVELCNYSDVYHNEFITLDIAFMKATANQGEIDKFQVEQGDVIFTKDSESWDDIAVPALVKEPASNLLCGYHLALVRSNRGKVDSGFLFRCIQSKILRLQLELAATGITRFGIPKSAIGKMKIPLPPLPTQRRIAAYLDKETTRIDALIKAKERLIELLEEKRQALITHAVTKGLDPDAPMQDSGVDWLGDVPVGWKVVNLKRVLSIIEYGISERISDEGEVVVLRMGDLEGGEILWDKVGFIKMSKDLPLLEEGDIVFNRTNSFQRVGKVGLFKGYKYPVSFASYLVRFRCNENANPRFLNYFLSCSYARAWGKSESLPSIGQVNLNPNRYAYLPVALPPINCEVQEQIADFLDDELSKIDLTVQKSNTSIRLLKERRAALISAAVTGQIEIPET